MDVNWIGKSHERVGGRDRVTGAQRYIADIHLDNVLHVKLVHLGVAHARINGIDASRALAVEGAAGAAVWASLRGSPGDRRRRDEVLR
jgi:CO/xanthine dehydrogenase Mo-binding subunit